MKDVAKRGPGSVPPETFEGIKKMYLEEPNKAKLARMFGVSLSTIYRALGKVDPETQREVRNEAMARILGKMSTAVEALVDDLQVAPEDASYMQKATVAGILTDKIEKLDKRLAESKHEDILASIPLPETVEAMAGALRNELRSVETILQLNSAAAGIVAEVRRMERNIGQRLVAVDVTDVTTIDDLDNAGGGNGSQDVGGAPEVGHVPD